MFAYSRAEPRLEAHTATAEASRTTPPQLRPTQVILRSRARVCKKKSTTGPDLGKRDVKIEQLEGY